MHSATNRTSSAPALTLAGVAALLASACCVVPLLLALVGISGAWISRLHALQPYSKGLMVLAIAALGYAGWHIFRPRPATVTLCDADGAACYTTRGAVRRWFWLVVVLTLIPLLAPLIAPWFY